MRRLWAFIIIAAIAVACQHDEERLDVVVGGEVSTVVEVTVPDSETRTSEYGSDKSVFENGVFGSDTTMRYILQVFHRAENGQVTRSERQVKFNSDRSIAFDVKLIPSRTYTFVVWADVVAKQPESEEFSDSDLHYNTSDLTYITIINDTWEAMDESRDAYAGRAIVENYNSSSNINIKLQRPNAKLRVLTSDVIDPENAPAKAKVTYTSKHRKAYNAVTGKVSAATLENVIHEYDIENIYNEPSADGNFTLFSDYFFANDTENDMVSFNIELMDASDNIVRTITFDTGIDVLRNHLTTIKGALLTSANSDSTTEID